MRVIAIAREFGMLPDELMHKLTPSQFVELSAFFELEAEQFKPPPSSPGKK